MRRVEHAFRRALSGIVFVLKGHGFSRAESRRKKLGFSP
jgi:hypothetical protein